ncbi:MAG: EpsG family protein [Bacteroidaceae bacterium]|nr:EpsG family protein [Bacteroidaceae bacterium]
MLFALQSLIVYGIIIWAMTYFGKIAYKRQYPQGFGGIDKFKGKKSNILSILTEPYILIPILIFCLFAAVRYRVGVDCESYKAIYYEIAQYGESIRASNIEIGFKNLVKFTNTLTNSHYLFFFILAFLEIGLYYIALAKERHALIFLGLAIMITGHYWSLMNGMRQNIAACAFVAMIPWLLNKKWHYFVAGTLLATTMHRSALLLLPLGAFAFFCKKRIPNKYLQLGIIGICFLLMNKFDNIFTIELMQFAGEAGYGEEEIEAYTALEATEYTFGFRMILQYAVFCIAVFYSKKMCKFYNSKVFNTMYNLFFIGICLSLVFYNNFTIKRILYYFSCFTPVIISYYMFYLWKNKKNLILVISIALLVVQTLWSIYSDISSKGINEPMLYKFDF